jgi:SAM-dependent methyltransferase
VHWKLDPAWPTLPFPGENFDLVVARCASPHIRNWSRLCKEMARVLKPGAWLHIVEQDPVLSALDGFLGTPLWLWSAFLREASLSLGNDPDLVKHLARYITEAGMTIQSQERHLLPFHTLSTGPARQEASRMQRRMWCEGVDAFGIEAIDVLRGEKPGCSSKEGRSFCRDVKRQIKDDINASVRFVSIVASKGGCAAVVAAEPVA